MTIWVLAKKFQGSTGSRLLTGNSEYAMELEERIAAFHGFEAGLLFNCGYMANLGLLSSLQSTILFDLQVHASTWDGIRLSRAKALPFRHNDLDHLEKRLKNGPGFVCVESVYSTDGTRAPLPEIFALCDRYGAHLIVDEAHAVGVYGPEGRGLVAATGRGPFAQIVTFGKALGVFGAIVLGSKQLKQHLINRARSFIYTTALPVTVLHAIANSYSLFPHMEKERTQLHRLCQILGSESLICGVKIPDVKKRAAQIQALGFDVKPLMYPTVARGKECLRICLHTFNTPQQVKELKQCLASL